MSTQSATARAGTTRSSLYDESDDEGAAAARSSRTRADDPTLAPDRSDEPQFTLRSLALGLVIGVLVAFSNTYFGLQTGWVSSMAMPSALIGFAYFKGLRALISQLGGPMQRFGFGEGFSEVENVLVQTVAGSVGTMPLGCGFVGVIPALEFLLDSSETPKRDFTTTWAHVDLAALDKTPGLHLSLGKLTLWALGLCFFGVIFAVPLRKEVIIRERLKFPSGTATALMIGVLHGGRKTGVEGNIEEHAARDRASQRMNDSEERQALIAETSTSEDRGDGPRSESISLASHEEYPDPMKHDWVRQIRLLTTAFFLSGLYTLVSYFVPQLHAIPVFGPYLSETWLWSLNPSPAYVGQGIIMGPATTTHMLIGAVLGWAVLSPLAKAQGWAPGPVEDWNTGSKGWIVWTSLAIMLADAVVSLGWLVLRTLLRFMRTHGPGIRDSINRQGLLAYISYTLRHAKRSRDSGAQTTKYDGVEPEYDAPPEHQIGLTTTLIGAVLTLAFCVFAVQYTFAGIIDIGLTLFALALALLLSIMGVRALGETDLNPVSGISKITQLIFAFVTPAGSRNAVTINLIAGGISEAGALQAGDLLQDLKTGHLLGASPKAQFWGQLIGSGVGAVVSALVYKLYTKTYDIPGGIFQVPTGYVWIFTARLVTGQGLPPQAATFAIWFAAVWSLLTALRIYGTAHDAKWTPFVPGGIAVAVGMYNTPSFTLARTIGGLLFWYFTSRRKSQATPMIVLSSGLILGEGLLSIVNLMLASSGAPHL